MITLFRKFFQSKVGIVVTLAFLGLIAFAFGTMDVANTGTFGGVAGADRVASVGDRRISASDYRDALTQEVDQLRGQNPTITMQQFLDQGGDEDVLEQMLQVWAISEYADQMGLRASKRLVDSEIMSIPGFSGADGGFDQNAFRLRLQALGRSEEDLREEIGMNLMARQLVVPAAQGSVLPESVTREYARLLEETRTGMIAAFPAVLYAPEGDPDDSVLQAYYDENSDLFTRPERRVLRYVVFGEEAITDVVAPTEQQIARRYQRDSNVYAPTEIRSFTRLVTPTRAAAQAVIDEVTGGIALEASAQAKGLSTVQIAPGDKARLTSEASPEVAEAGFAAERGGLSEPAQGELGWYVLRVDTVEQIAGQTLEQASAAIREQLITERRTLAINELTSQIERELDDGRAISEVAEDLGLEVQSTPPITAQGQIYGTFEAAPESLAPVIDVAFDMDEAEPQLAEVVPGEQFLVFDIAEITESAVAPLDEIREDVTFAWRREEGMTAAGLAAARVLERMEEGSTLAEAMRAEDVPLPPAANLSMNRRQLNAQRQQGQVPPPLMLLFSMAAGTAKPIELASNDRWFVVELTEIDAPELGEDNEVLPVLVQSLGETLSNEYAEGLVKGIQASLAIDTNDAAIQAVNDQLTGRSN